MEYYMTNLKEHLKIDGIFSFHSFEYVKNFRGIEEKHDFWEFVYVDYGEIQVLSDTDSFLLTAGEAFLHKPEELHNVFSMEEYTSVIIFSFSCDCEALNCLCKKILKICGKEKFILEEFYQSGLKVFCGPLDIFEQSKVKLSETVLYGMQQITLRYLEILLLKLIQREIEEDDSSTNIYSYDRNMNMERIKKNICSHLYDRVSLEEICRESKCSKSYAEKLFKSTMGVGVMDYYNQLRIKEAKRMISEGTTTFTEIADKLQYSSVHYFSKCFKKATNMTPGGYKRSVKNKKTI